MKKRKQFSRAQNVWGDHLRKDLGLSILPLFTSSIPSNIALANILFTHIKYVGVVL